MLALSYSANVIPLNPRRQEDTILSLPRSKEHWTLRTVWFTQGVHERSIFWAFAQLFFLHTWILKQVVHFESFHSIFESIDMHSYFKTFRASILFFIVPLVFFFLGSPPSRDRFPQKLVACCLLRVRHQKASLELQLMRWAWKPVDFAWRIPNVWR